MSDTPVFVWVELCLIVLGICILPFLKESSNG